mmetsp:Transcript_2568/g.3966  ORF Transcript_2568/g.3966 Transcript_2568/m.3966 type:complete len:92 (-) Transcript_2568:734-1009(-)
MTAEHSHNDPLSEDVKEEGTTASPEKVNGKNLVPPSVDCLTEPEEDERNDFSLPSLNKDVVERLFKEHAATFSDIANMDSSVLDILAQKMN